MGIPQIGVKEFLEVPVRIDTALDMTDKEYDEYLKTCDKSLLKFKDGQTPIYFKLRKILPYKLVARIENDKMDMVKRKDGDKITSEMVPKMAWILEEVRFSIVDILNPPDCPADETLAFKVDSDGLCAPEILAGLVATNSHMDLWSARQSLLKSLDKKKSKLSSNSAFSQPTEEE